MARGDFKMTGEPAPRLLRSRRGGGCAPRASRASACRSSPSPVPPVSWPCRLGARARRRLRGARRRRARRARARSRRRGACRRDVPPPERHRATRRAAIRRARLRASTPRASARESARRASSTATPGRGDADSGRGAPRTDRRFKIKSKCRNGRTTATTTRRARRCARRTSARCG